MFRIFTLTITVALLLIACAEPGDTLEERISGLISEAELAAESRSLDFFDSVLAEDYSDDRGNSRREILRILAGYFFRNRNIYLVTHEALIEALDGEVRAIVFVGMAGSPDHGLEQLETMRADFYRLELMFSYDEPFRVKSARWRRAQPAEVFPG